MSENASNRSNAADRSPVRAVLIYSDGRTRAIQPSRLTPWGKGAAWGRATGHALPADAPAVQPEVGPGAKVKDPRKVAAGKARAAQAKAAREAAAKKAAKPTPAPKPKTAKATAPKGGARANAGRKPQDAEAGAMVVVAFRVTQEQKDKLAKLGNGEFIRKRIDSATVPAGR